MSSKGRTGYTSGFMRLSNRLLKSLFASADLGGARSPMLTDLDTIKQYLEIETTNYDELLTQIADYVQGRIEQFIQYPIMEAIGVVYVTDSLGGERLFLPRIPVTSVTSVFFNTASNFSDAKDEIDSEKYRVDSDLGVIEFLPGNEPARSSQSIQVTYDSGFADGMVPDDLLRAYLAQIRHEFQERHQMGKESISDGSSTIRVVGFRLLPDVKETLDLWRRME